MANTSPSIGRDWPGDDLRTDVIEAVTGVSLSSEGEIPRFLIPECCREGWDTCPHVINQKREPERRNPAV